MNPKILECGADMLEYEGFCMDKTQENMEMIQEFISLNLDGGLERTKKRSQRVTMLLARTNFDSMVDENGDKLRPKKFIEVKIFENFLKFYFFINPRGKSDELIFHFNFVKNG